jgi:hypothetical protein
MHGNKISGGFVDIEKVEKLVKRKEPNSRKNSSRK